MSYIPVEHHRVVLRDMFTGEEALKLKETEQYEKDKHLRQAVVYGANASTDYYRTGGLEVREQGLVDNTQTADIYAPRIGFHWANRFGMCLIANTNGFKFMNNDLTAYKSVWGDSFYANDKYRFNGSSTEYGKNSIELYYTNPFRSEEHTSELQSHA